ncbi:MAG: GntR family transcriptional regulator [Kiloniellales bacterium]|nr:GntR family transcriptional regulator [Kiloniellales bacterium]
MDQGQTVVYPETTAVDRRLRAPLYHQIYLILRQKICDGAYGFGALLPGEQELSRDFNVSRITAKRALDELADAGLVVRQRGRGTSVSFRAPSPPVRSSVDGLLENLLMMGLKTEVRLLGFGYVAASEEIARALGCQAGAAVQRAVRVRSLEDRPLSYLTTHVPEAIGRAYDEGDLARTPLLALLERGGIKVGSAEQVITATLADTTVAPLLEVEIGAPLLQVTRIVADEAQRPVEHLAALYPPERYQYRMVLSRVQSESEKRWSPAA